MRYITKKFLIIQGNLRSQRIVTDNVSGRRGKGIYIGEWPTNNSVLHGQHTIYWTNAAGYQEDTEVREGEQNKPPPHPLSPISHGSHLHLVL